MTKATTKYPTKLCGRLIPVGTEVRLATLEEMQKEWPSITYLGTTTHIGVWFPDMPHPTIVTLDDLRFA